MGTKSVKYQGIASPFAQKNVPLNPNDVSFTDLSASDMAWYLSEQAKDKYTVIADKTTEYGSYVHGFIWCINVIVDNGKGITIIGKCVWIGYQMVFQFDERIKNCSLISRQVILGIAQVFCWLIGNWLWRLLVKLEYCALQKAECTQQGQTWRAGRMVCGVASACIGTCAVNILWIAHV